MPTFTLGGNIDELPGGDSTRARLFEIRTTRPLVVGSVTYERLTRIKLGPGAWSMQLPVDDGPQDYAFVITCPQVGMRWVVPAQEDGAAVDLADFPDDTDNPFVAQRSAIDHGDVSGAIELSASYSLHEINLTGPTTITPTAPKPGADMVVRVTGAGTLTLVGVEWDTAEVEVPGVFILTWWASAGWRAASVSPVALTEVTPAAPTWDDFAGAVVIPSSPAGVIYKIGATTLSVGSNPGYSGTSVTVTAQAAAGYEIATGAMSWPHTFPGWTTLAGDSFTAADGTVVNGRTTPVGSKVWAADSTALVVVGNQAKWDPASANLVTSRITVPGAAIDVRTDVRVTVDYDMSANGGGFIASVWVGGRYKFNASTSADRGIRLMKTATGSTTATLSMTSGPTLVAESGQSLTGHPVTGTLMVEILDTLFKAYVNGVLIGTATSVETMPNTSVWFACQNKSVLVDNFLGEVLT